MKKKYFLISHNELANGLKKALEMIIGTQKNLYAFGLMPGGHPDLITNQIEALIDEETQVVILGDIAGGSVCNSAIRLTQQPNVVLVTGMNLPLAMEIIVSQSTSEQQIAAIIEEVRKGMTVQNLRPSIKESFEDFF